VSVLESAIATEVDMPDSVIIGWCLVAAYKSPEQTSETGYYHAYMDGQPYHSTLGLLNLATDRVRGIDTDE
jgi:hypothetical protein